MSKKIISNNNNKIMPYSNMKIIIEYNFQKTIAAIKMQVKRNNYNGKQLKWRGRDTKNFNNKPSKVISKNQFVKIEVQVLYKKQKTKKQKTQ